MREQPTRPITTARPDDSYAVAACGCEADREGCDASFDVSGSRWLGHALLHLPEIVSRQRVAAPATRLPTTVVSSRRVSGETRCAPPTVAVAAVPCPSPCDLKHG
jgi:hypothetical protein